MSNKTKREDHKRERQIKQASRGQQVSKKEAIMQFIATGVFFTLITIVIINMF